MPTPMPVETVGEFGWGLSGLLAPGKEKKGKENETNGKAHPVKATHFDYITKPDSSINGRSSHDHSRAPKHRQAQGHGYSRNGQDRPPKEDRKYRHSTGDYRNGSSNMHHYHRPDTQRRYSREDDEELMRIHSQQQKYDDRGERRSGSLPGHYSQDGRGPNRGGSLPGRYSQGSPTSPRGPPKPPRRQESLNRVHIPEGPDTDPPTSASDHDVWSPSSGSNSPKNWNVNPLSGQQSSSTHMRDRSWSPSKEYSRSPPRRHGSQDRKQRHYDTKPREPSDPYGSHDRSSERKHKHYDNQHYDHRSDNYSRDRSFDRKQKHQERQQYDYRSEKNGQRDRSLDRKPLHERRKEKKTHRDMSPDRKPRHFDNQQYDRRSEIYGLQDTVPDRREKHYTPQDQQYDQRDKHGMSADQHDWQYPSGPPPLGNGHHKEDKITYPPTDPYSHDIRPSHHSRTSSLPVDYQYEQTQNTYGEYYQQQSSSQQQKSNISHDPYGNSWIKEKIADVSQPTSNARPLVLPQGNKVPESPRPIYRSDGEIDLREPTYKRSREPDMFAINQAPPAHSYPSSPLKQTSTTFNYYPELLPDTESQDVQWDDPSQQVGQSQSKQSGSLRTVRGVKAYDQHVKKYKRPTSLGEVPRQQQNSYSQERPRSTIDRRASEDSLTPSVGQSRNSAFAAGPSKASQSDSLYSNQFNPTLTNTQQYFNPKMKMNQSHGGYGMTNMQASQPEIYSSASDSNKLSSLLPKDWPKDYPAQMTMRSPVPSDPENSVNAKQMDSGKQTIFCLVSQVVPTSPSPELSPEPMQREFVEIENGKVSPVMKQPINVPNPSHNQYKQTSLQNGHSQHGSYSPVRSQMEYQSNKPNPTRKPEYQQKREGRQSVTRSVSRESSMGNDSDIYFRQRHPPGYAQQALKIAPSQIRQSKDQVTWANPRDSHTGASLSSGYHSSPEFEREENQPAPKSQKLFYDRERFSDTEYRIEGTGDDAEGEDIPIVPIKDLIKKINRDVETNGGLDLIVYKRPPKTGLKTILLKDAKESNQIIKDDTCFSQPTHPKDTQMQTKEMLGKVPMAYYNEKYITATAVPCEVIDPERRPKSTKPIVRPLSSTEPLITADSYKEVESRPIVRQESVEESEEDTKPINAKERRAYYESLKPLSKEEEIQSVHTSKIKTQPEVQVSSTQQSSAPQPNAMYGNIKWPKDYPITEPAFSKQSSKPSYSEPPKPRRIERSPSPVRRSDVRPNEETSKLGEREAYYDRLRQRGQGTGQGYMGRRSQSLPRLSASPKEEKKVESNPVSDPSVELSNRDSGTKRLSMGAQLFHQKKLEMERHNKKQEILDKVKSQLHMRRAGSEPDLSQKDADNDPIHSLEKNRDLLSTHVLGKRIRGRDSADFEYVLNQLQTAHDQADQDADEVLHPQYYQPYDHRAEEIPLLAQKVAELQELMGIHAIPGSGKGRSKKVKRATSDVSGMRPNQFIPNSGELLQEVPGKAKKGQDFFPYRQATHPKKMTKKDEFGLEGGHESTSDEDKTPRPAPPGTNTKLYRHPKSSDNLGFSSDSSPERPSKVKPKIVVTDQVRLVNPDVSAIREQRRATREAFFSGEDNSRGPSPLPTKIPAKNTKLPPPIMQSVKFSESPKLKRAVLTKPPPAPALTKFKENQLHLQPSGCRDSISTVDSAGLAQPFEDMTEEYQNMMMDHQAMEMGLPGDQERASSVESLVHLVSGSDKQQRKQPKQTKQSTQKSPLTNPNASYSPEGSIPLADDEDYASSGGDEADLEDFPPGIVTEDASAA